MEIVDTVVAVFSDQEAETAVKQLASAGFEIKNRGVVGNATTLAGDLVPANSSGAVELVLIRIAWITHLAVACRMAWGYQDANVARAAPLPCQ